MKTLILTGWGYFDYACAAALALRSYPLADVYGMSTRRLPEYLSEVTGYQKILILGVGLSANPDLLAKALAKLRKKEVKVAWLSCLPLADNVGEAVTSQLEILIDGESLTETVGKYLKPDGSNLNALIEQESREPFAQAYHELLDAAMYVYRNYQDERSYGNAIRHLAHMDAPACWRDSEKQLVEHYRRYGNRELVGKSAPMQALLEKINKVAPHTHARVMIYGESGTGKETVAQQIHNKSSLRNEPYLAFNCASITPNLLETRFFGYEKGAFTGATEQKKGLFELANGGTLFLDEIGELPLEAQGTLLRVLEGGRFMRVGGKEEIEVRVRLLTATNRDLAAMVRDGKFREDLFHRLNVVQIRVPPLREHKNDVEQIANGYWRKQHQRWLAPEQVAALMEYDYPGNVRELINLLERASVLGEEDFGALLKEHKEMLKSLSPQKEEEVPDELDAAIRRHVKRVYEKYDQNLSKTAEALKAARNTVKKYLED